MREKSFENTIKREIKAHGDWCVKFFGCAYSRAGVPDILASIGGRFIAIEVKAENGKVSEIQKAVMKEIRQHGGKTYVAYPQRWEWLKRQLWG